RVPDQPTLKKAKERPLKPQREVRALVRENVRGSTKDVFGDEVIATAHAHPDLRRRVDGITGDISSRIAQADDQHALAGELLGTGIRDRMSQLTVEAAGQLRHTGLPIDAGGAYQPAVSSLHKSVGAVRRATRPKRHEHTLPLRLRALHSRPELDVALQIVVGGVRPQV